MNILNINIDVIHTILKYDKNIKYITEESRRIPWTYCVYKIGKINNLFYDNIFHNAKKIYLNCYQKNYTTEDIVEIFKRVPNVNKLNLVYCNLKELPLSIVQKINHLTLFNTNICDFEKYKYTTSFMDIEYNEMTPIKIYTDKNDNVLEQLYCTNVISDYFNLSNLKILNLYNCNATTIYGLPNLTFLSVSDSVVNNIFLEDSPYLNEVVLSASVINIIELPKCVKYLNINRIQIEAQEQTQTPAPLSSSLSSLSSLYDFEKYDLYSLCIFNDYVIERVPYIKTLKILDLNFCNELKTIDKDLKLDEFICLDCIKLSEMPKLCNLKNYTISNTKE